MLRYDFDIVSLRPHTRGQAVLFRDRSTASAFASAPRAIRNWLVSAGFRDGISGSTQVPGLFPEADEADRARVMEQLEHAMPDLDCGGPFDARAFLTQALRARAERPEVFAMATFWSGKAAAG